MSHPSPTAPGPALETGRAPWSASQGPIVELRGLAKVYRTARGELTLFSALDLEVQAGEMLAIVGQSGAGKSTLLHLLGALDSPTAGQVRCAGVDLGQMNPTQAAAFRNREIGYVWQFHYLLPEFTAEENVAMPLRARGLDAAWALASARCWLGEVGLADRATHRPGELSGGEQQRVALARALVTNPRILLADEPTGDLDASTAAMVFELIAGLLRAHRLTSILVTHNMELAARCTRVLRLEHGRLVPCDPNASPAAFPTAPQPGQP